MSLQLILGGSGSGKTTLLYQTVIRSSVEQPDRRYFLIVPEQFTMQAQKDIIASIAIEKKEIVAMHPNHATMNIDVVSFQRLAYRVFEELAVENAQVLDDMGKSMVLRKVAGEEKRRLGLFHEHLNQAGFISQMKAMLAEFTRYGVTPDMLRDMAPEAKSPLLKQKLEDFAVIFQAFRDYIEGHFITTEEILDVLCRVLGESALVKNSVVALDGYVGFTPVQYRLAELLMVHARQVIVTVAADPSVPMYGSMGMQNLFYMSHRMVCRLTELAGKNRVEKLPDIVVKDRPCARFCNNGELAFLEEKLFRYGRGHYEGEMRGGIELFEGTSPSAEIAQVVRRIRQLLVDGGNMRYRDMAVVTGDLDGYGKEISHQFELNGIPYFMDQKKDVLDNPLVELIRSGLEAVYRDFSYESVLRFLRTGLATDDREMTDRMENYVVALGIRGAKRWAAEWERVWRGGERVNLKELNAFKQEALAPLFAMKEAFGQKDLTVAGMVEAVRAMLGQCRVEEKLGQFEAYFTSSREYRLAKEYGQVYGLVDGMLERLSGLLGGEKVSRREFIEILDAGFGEISVGAIPDTVDRVIVGDITRTRLAHVKVLFFVGVNDGVIPIRKDGGSLLSDQDREFFGKHDLELAPTAREDSFQQRFYLYLMMTKPSEKLAVSYAAVGGDGKSRRPSYLIGELQKMFPELLCRRSEAATGDGACRPYSLAEARRQLIEGLGHYREGGEDRCFLELYRWFASSQQYGEEAGRLADAAFYAYDSQGLGRAVARALYGNIMAGSVTRLEQYAACAYAHFLKYGLDLEERQRYEVAAADIGNLFHDSIDLCFQQVKELGRDWRDIGDGERQELVHRCVEQVTGEYGNTILNSSSRNAYLARRVERITQRTVWALQQQIRRGDFTPAGFEVSFSAADNLNALKISLSEDEALHLRGRVDRLDLCEDGQQVYVKIIDYKSGSTSFDLAALYYGLQLQLVVYMDAAMEMVKQQFPDKEVVPAGILYYNIADPFVAREDGGTEDVDVRILRQLRMNGLINSQLDAIRHLDNTIEKESDVIPVVMKDGSVQEGRSSVASRERFELLRGFVHEKLQGAGREILEGEIAVSPYKSGQRTACDYCPYHAVCGFDKKTSGYEYRRLKNKKTEEIWEELCRENQ